jgi:hypothetical protein
MRFSALTLAISLSALLAGCSDFPTATSPTRTVSPSSPAFVLGPSSSQAGQIFLQTAPTQCVDVAGSGTANGTPLVLWTCGAATKTNQQFAWQADGTIRAYGGGTLCVTDLGNLGKDGDKVVISACAGATGQKWTATSAGAIQGINGKCIAVPSATNNAGLTLAACTGAALQLWDSNAPAATTPPTPAPTAPSAADSVDFRAIAAGVRPRGFGQGTYTLTAPAAGGRTLYVATTGSDANAGTSSAAPLKTIAKAAQLARAGDVVTIGDGTYGGAVVVANSGTAAAPIVFQAATRGGVVLTDGNASFRPATWSGGTQETGQLYVTVRGLTFRRYAANAAGSPGPSFPAALKAARGWRVEDCLFDDAGNTGIQIEGSYVTVVRTTIQYSYLEALSAWAHSSATSVTSTAYTPLDGIQVVDVVLRGNHTLNQLQAAGTADYSVKFLTTRGALIDNVESYENNGPGFWFDTQNSNFTVRNSYFHDNKNITGTTSTGRGLNLEANWAPGLVERNVFSKNASMGLAVTATSGVTIRQNLFIDNPRCMELTNDVARSATFPLKNVAINSNQCGNWTNFSGIQTMGGATAFTTPATMNIKADSNVYQPSTASIMAWWENKAIGAAYSLADFRTKWGWEAHGRIGTVNW